MGVYIYVVAAAIAVFAILTVFKVSIEKVKENPAQTPEVQQKFFIGVAISEALPIILLIIGLTNQKPVRSMEELIFPIALIIALMAYALFFIFLQRKVGVDEENRAVVNTFSYIALALTMSIPVISFVFIFMALPV